MNTPVDVRHVLPAVRVPTLVLHRTGDLIANVEEGHRHCGRHGDGRGPGDRAWRDRLEGYHVAVRRELARFRGRELDTAGDGVFAAFDGPARAVRCVCVIRDAVAGLELSIRAGLHTGECEVMGDKLGGLAVHIGARVAAAAGHGEVWVSSTVKDLVAGSGLRFADRGSHALKGVPGEWRLFAVEP